MNMVYQVKGICLDDVSHEEDDAFLKSSAPKTYEELQQGLQTFWEGMEKMAWEQGVKLVSRKDLENYLKQYGISLKDLLKGKEITKVDK